VLLDEQKRKFSAYQETLNSHMRARVTEEVNYIEQVMKKRVDVFKDVHSAQDELGSGKSLGGDNDLSLKDKYSHLLKKGANKNSSDMDPLGYGAEKEQQEAIFAEMERLKQGESQAREEVVALQDFIRKSRTLQRLREAVTK